MSLPAHHGEVRSIPGLPQPARDRLLALLTAKPPLSDRDRLRRLNDLDDLCLPWQLDRVLRHELPAEREAHVQRPGRCLWIQP